MEKYLEGPRLSPRQGKTKNLVVLCHGYGSNGDDLIALAQSWSTLLPDTAYFAPHAPLPMPEAPSGRAWFPLTGLDRQALAAGCKTAAPVLEKTLEREREKLSLAWGDIALVGFSQGAMMALYAGIARTTPLAAIVAYSGAFAGGEHVGQTAPTPSLLIHGLLDDRVPPVALLEALQGFSALNIPCHWHFQPHLGHAIDETGLELGGAWLRAGFSGSLRGFTPPQSRARA